ncbi:hypothetical protein PVAP13_8NG299401 [Panicum virgatum]|uniref:Amine oxidase domain-containing protein n=1 Tax=Panicum virgatum TaxID=38727 RepID=A0A8T0PF16_PANVG|nr:hypothetical protein PVAP13_8NG299401 [Panicum virgatum]
MSSSTSSALVLAAAVLLAALTVAQHGSLAAAAGPRVIIVGAGMSGISAAKTLSEAGITDLLILEATDRIGGRMHKKNFSGINVEIGANWVEGVNGGKMNPIWPIVNETLKLRNFLTDFSVATNIYKEDGGLYDEAYVQKIIDRADAVESKGEKLSASLPASGSDDISILAMQRLYDHQPNGPATPVDMVVTEISYSSSGVSVRTEDKSVYKADYVMVSTSLGVLQTDLIHFKPKLPTWKILVIYQFDMAVYTKIFLKFPKRFWPVGKGKEFFLYASTRRGYYAAWQQLEKQYPGANALLVTVTDEESRRIEQQSDNQTKAEIMEVLRKMFPGEDVPDATDILVPRWWSDRFYKGTYANWPVGVSRYEVDQLRAPVGRVYFTGEHTSDKYTGYVHGAYLAGIDSAEILINCAQKKMCKYLVKGKYD